MDTKQSHKNTEPLSGGFSSAKTPGGLVDDNAEVFSDGKSLKGIHEGKTKNFTELPEEIQLYFEGLYKNDKTETPECEDLHRNYFNCKTYREEIKQHTLCNYGGLDNQADYNKDGQPQKEYWNCGHRGTCKAELIVCKPDCILKYNLTLREVEIIKLLASGKTDQETADKLGITLNTARTHERNIREKLGFNHRGEIIKFAFQNNITN